MRQSKEFADLVRALLRVRHEGDAGGGQRVDVLKAEGRLGALSRRQLVGTLQET